MNAPKASFFLGASARLQSLAQAAERLLEVQQVYQGFAPKDLAKFSKVGALERGVLVLFAANGAIAAKLKQLLPTLLSKFQQRGVEVSAIRVEVQAGSPRGAKRPIHGKQIDAAGLDSLRKLQDKLDDGDLKQALAKLLSHQLR